MDIIYPQPGYIDIIYLQPGYIDIIYTPTTWIYGYYIYIYTLNTLHTNYTVNLKFQWILSDNPGRIP